MRSAPPRIPDQRISPHRSAHILNRPRVTKIGTPKGRPDHRVIYIDGKPSLTVPARILSELNLEPGLVLSAPLEKELESAGEMDKARSRAIHLLTFRLRTEEELRRSLIRADFSHQAIEETIRVLLKDGILNDRLFAELFAEEKRRVRGYAPARIESDLRSRGVAREIAHGAAWGVYGEGPGDVDSCLLDEGMTILRRRQVHYEGLPPHVARRRMAGLLGRAGYPVSVAIDAVNAVIEEMEAEGLLAGTEGGRTDK